MTVFAEFALTITYPPNPIRNLDNSLTKNQAIGQDIYMLRPTTGVFFTCNDCHTLDPLNEHFGTSGLSTVEGDAISQEFKVPHLRNMYQKVGKFGNSGVFSPTAGDFGPQVKGFGFMHDGNMDTLDNFFQGDGFRFSTDDTVNEQRCRQIIDFVMVIDSNMAPIVGQQVTVNEHTRADTISRADLLVERALIVKPRPECDLIAEGVVDGNLRGYLMLEDGKFQSDRSGETVTYDQLIMAAQTPGGAITFTGVPPESGKRLGIDRNLDRLLDRP